MRKFIDLFLIFMAALLLSSCSRLKKLSEPTRVDMGVVYPFSGRLEAWGKEVLPIIQMALEDINSMDAARDAGVQFDVILRSSETTPEGSLAAVRDLVENEGVEFIVGLPTSLELEGAIRYLRNHNVAAISSASTAPYPSLSQPDSIYRLAPPELYLARTFAQFGLDQGYRKAAVIFREDEWGPAYARAFAEVFKRRGYPVETISIQPTHPETKQGAYVEEVAQLSKAVGKLGADEDLLVFMAVWEGEDLAIIDHAIQDETLSSVRWMSALLYPSLLGGSYGEMKVPEAPQFAYDRKMWGQEFKPTLTPKLQEVLEKARSELGSEPRFEHVFVYDALQIAARSILMADQEGSVRTASMIPTAAAEYAPVTGPIQFDHDGDRTSGNVAYYGVYPVQGGFEYYHYAHFDSQSGSFEVLVTPVPRPLEFCPQC